MGGCEDLGMWECGSEQIDEVRFTKYDLGFESWNLGFGIWNLDLQIPKPQPLNPFILGLAGFAIPPHRTPDLQSGI